MDIQIITATVTALSAVIAGFFAYLNKSQSNKKDLQSVVDDRVKALVERLEAEILRKDEQISRLEELVDETRVLALQVIQELRKYDGKLADGYVSQVSKNRR